MLGPDQQRVVKTARAEVRRERQCSLPVLTGHELVDGRGEFVVQLVEAGLTGRLLVLSSWCHLALLPPHGLCPGVGLWP